MKHLTRNTIVSFLFFAFYFFIAGTSLAQSNPTPISSRDYLGIEIGASDNWLGGATSDFFFTAPYPYSDAGNSVNIALPFTDLGSGTGFHVEGTLDLSFSDLLGLQGRVFYRSGIAENTLQRTFSYKDAQVTVEDNYKATLGLIGLSAALRLQVIQKSLYAIAGLEFSSLISNKFSGYENIITNPSGNFAYTNLPSKTGSHTLITIPENSMTDYFNSTQLAIKLGIGTFIGLGTGHLVLAPELNVAIPLSAVLKSQQSAYLTNSPDALTQPSASTPKLFYLSFSVALKFPM